MTAEQLEELLSAYGQGDDVIKQKSALGSLQVIAPSLARRVIAAENLVDLFEDRDSGSNEWWGKMDVCVTAYREASK